MNAPAPAVFDGNFSDFKIVKTRSVAQVVVEIPLERGKQFIAAFGVPQPGSEIPVAIALLDPAAAAEPLEQKKKPKQRFCDLGVAQQAGILCNDPKFQQFVQVGNDEEAADYIRAYCEVDSRADIDTSPYAHQKWNDLMVDYGRWKGR